MALSGADINKIRANHLAKSRKNIFLKKNIEDKSFYDLKSVPKELQTNNVKFQYEVKEVVFWTNRLRKEYFGQAGKVYSAETHEKFRLAEEIIFPTVEICVGHFLTEKEVDDYLKSYCT